MKKITIETTIQVHESTNSLSDSDTAILKAAKKALDDSYSPYSKFQVGAALVLENGKIIPGSNQENASYPLCLCAERIALGAAASQYPRIPVVAMAVTIKNAKFHIDQPVSPCGACRQVLLETEFMHKKDMRIVLQGESGDIYVLNSAKDLLPLYFDGTFLDGK